MKVKKTICTQHDHIQGLLLHAMKAGPLRKNVHIGEALAQLNKAREMAKRMETRLEQYRTGIEAMGFRRRKNAGKNNSR